MDTQLTTQIANYLKVSPNQIKEIREWAKVFWVAVHGKRPTFVSKKVVQMEIDSRIPQSLEEARTLASLRFHVWDEECREICQKLMSVGINRDSIYPAHSLYKEMQSLEESKKDCRTTAAIARIAYKLTH